MHFVELRLTGFKSFPEPTRVPIDRGLTGIVGPNGCGKSNLFEALRWVLGASSAKALRGAEMADVVFAGTRERPAREWAEVVLTTEPGEGGFPPPYDREERLEIARRVYRDGRSSFRINGREARAQDARTLFADAATGANSPALVRQGQVSELINAKPSNRRAILEQAAGVAGVLARRRETEKRLNATDDNLSRLRDIEREIAQQLASLEKQAREAERYRALSEEVRGLERRIALARWRVKGEETAAAEDALMAARAAAGQAIQTETEARLALEKAEAAYEPAREEQVIAANLLHRKEVERDRLHAEAERAVADYQKAVERARDYETDAEREREAARLAEEEEADAKARLAEFADLPSEDERLEDLKHAAQAARAKRQSAESAWNALNRAANEAAAERARLTRERDAAWTRVAALDDDVETRRQEAERADAELDSLRADHPQGAVDAAAQRERAAAAALDAAQQAYAQAESAARETSQDLAALRKTLATLQAEHDSLKALLSRKERGGGSPVADLIRAEPGFEKALAAALGADADHGLDGPGPHWSGPPEALSSPETLPERAEPLAGKVEVPEALAARINRTGVVAREDLETLKARLAPGWRFVTREGACVRWDGFVTPAGEASSAALILERRNRLAAIESELGAVREKETAAKTSEAAAREALFQANTALRQARSERDKAETAHAEAKRRVLAHESALSRAETKAAAAADALQSLEVESEAAAARAAELDAALEEPEERDFDTELEDLRTALDAARQEAAEAEAALAGAEGERKARERALAEARQRAERATKRKTLAQDRAADLHKRSEQARLEADRLATQPGQLKTQAEDADRAVEAAKDRRDRAEAALREAEALRRTAQSEAREAEKAAAAAREAVGRAEERFEGQRRDLRTLTQETCAQLHLSREDLENLMETEPEAFAGGVEDLTRAAERARAKRETMGAVNLKAGEEAEIARTRLSTLEAERLDLEEASAKLQAAVADLNEEGRQRLRAAFTAVEARFAHLFKQLFQGGEAHLELIEGADPLDAGLDIKARPPGKRMGPLSLMSGGEQALTAIALIFAVFEANPSPVCVLDEVDAPLDDANVDRFCTLLEAMARESQTRFLIVTHHALTMSRVDRLFGVTMAERGVSRLVSVDLHHASAMAAE